MIICNTCRYCTHTSHLLPLSLHCPLAIVQWMKNNLFWLCRRWGWVQEVGWGTVTNDWFDGFYVEHFASMGAQNLSVMSIRRFPPHDNLYKAWKRWKQLKEEQSDHKQDLHCLSLSVLFYDDFSYYLWWIINSLFIVVVVEQLYDCLLSNFNSCFAIIWGAPWLT